MPRLLSARAFVGLTMGLSLLLLLGQAYGEALGFAGVSVIVWFITGRQPVIQLGRGKAARKDHTAASNSPAQTIVEVATPPLPYFGRREIDLRGCFDRIHPVWQDLLYRNSQR